ncbi:ABC transporter ATP-binding protein [Neobacillus sp. PS3-12]|uniref:ABC transporter ATP-binding protein n=1 Tax=Neobacillus sp. PS3-12 TaxID=3070677 RepID=UPI0027DFBFCC|nr:ABC transporter ATP-binding protein [Neobacillus sp. PS3-12]WML50986.1 ABC transporter ATP-binding protein [Neobacillus sp. PS3-12]
MLHVNRVRKSFGKTEVVKGVTFSVEKGEAFGLLGPNGAGKSTTISMICGLLPYNEGEITVGGFSVKDRPLEIKRKIGVVPQDIALYPTMSARDNLLFWGKMYGLSGRNVKKRADEVLDFVGLHDRAKDKIETFSGGMKRRINIGAALMHKPELLIMDEPTVGIDPQSRNHILETVKELNKEGMTIIYTSHYMEEVEFLCERIGIIDHGEVIAIGTKDDLCNRLSGGTIIKMEVNVFKSSLLDEINSLPITEKVIGNEEEKTIEIFVNSGHQALGELVTAAVKNNVVVSSIQVQEPNLESLFLQLTWPFTGLGGMNL